jgi:RNA polymerase sigma-70 factor (ECF subfamily)
MARSQGGDRAAYALLLKEVTPYLRAVVARHVRAREDLDDVVQDVLLTIHAVRETYDPKRPFKPWLLAIARHRVYDWLRRRMRLSARELMLDAEDETFCAPDANLEARELVQRNLQQALQALPAGQRQAFEMLKVRQMSLKQASAATGLSVPALKVAVHRAVRALRKALSKE